VRRRGEEKMIPSWGAGCRVPLWEGVLYAVAYLVGAFFESHDCQGRAMKAQPNLRVIELVLGLTPATGPAQPLFIDITVAQIKVSIHFAHLL
jgi:hypothetical protein